METKILFVQKNGTQNNLIVVKGYVTSPGDQPIIAVNKADTSAALVTVLCPPIQELHEQAVYASIWKTLSMWQ